MTSASTIRRTAWLTSLALSAASVVTGVRIEAMTASDWQISLYWATLGIAVLIILGLNVDHRLDVGRWYRGSDVTRARVAVVTIGDIAVVILSFQIWIAGTALALVAASIYSHGIGAGNVGHLRS